MLTDHWGGSWSDAEKSPTNNEDDLLCWAAAAANILEWTDWGKAGGMANTDEMFAYYQDHWTDMGSLPSYGWDWWFDGTNAKQGLPEWSQVDVPGGGFYLSENFNAYFHQQVNDSQVMYSIDQYLHSGYGITLGTYGPGGGHSITCWGYNYDLSDPSDYKGIWVTDSDDYKHSSDPPDELRYYEVVYDSGKWYLQDYYGSDAWYISAVYALEKVPWVLPGDANGDGAVNRADAEIVSANWLKQSETSWTDGDFNNDGRVDDIDATMMAANWQLTPPPATSSSAAIEQETKIQAADPQVLPGYATADGSEPWAVPYDLDHSGKIDLGDLAFFASVYREKPGITTESPYAYAADFDHSGTVDLADLAFFADNYHLNQPNSSIVDSSIVDNRQKQTAAIWADGDFNNDGRVNDFDAKILAQHWMMSVEGMMEDDNVRRKSLHKQHGFYGHTPRYWWTNPAVDELYESGKNFTFDCHELAISGL